MPESGCPLHRPSNPPATPPAPLPIERAVLAATLDPIVTIDAAGSIRSVSDSIERVFGWTPAELIGQNVNVLMPEPHHSAHDAYLANYTRTGITNIMNRPREFHAVRKDGTLFPIELCVSRADVPGVAGPVFVGMIRDISVQKNAERALRESERKFRTLAESMPQMVWTAGPDGSVDYHSRPSALGGMRYEPSQRSWLWQEVIHPDDAQRTREAWDRSMQTGEVFGVEHRARMADGQHRWQLSRGVPVRGERGEVVKWYCTSTDIDALKAAERELAKHRDSLDELVKARTAEVEQARSRLHMADRLASIGTLAAGLGHDMNNVLLPVRARLNALHAAGDDLPEGLRVHVEAIRKSVSYLQQLADGLHFLAMDPEREDRDDTETELRSWWSQTGPLLSKAVPKHVKVAASIPQGLPRVPVPPHKLTQAILNLVVNAGEAIPPDRQGRVRLWAERAEADGRTWVNLGVTDNGRGMPDEVRRRAADMFFTTKPRGLGTGLGLPLALKVADRAGGSLQVDSTPRKGTTVILRVPASGMDAPQQVRSHAVVTITDGRVEAMARFLLEGVGASVECATAGDGAEVWVADPRVVKVADAAAWRDRHPAGRLVLLGAPARAAGRWSALRPIVLQNTQDLETMREVLTRAVTQGRASE